MNWTRVTEVTLPPPDTKVVTWDPERGLGIGYWMDRINLAKGSYWNINGRQGGLGTRLEVKPPVFWMLPDLPSLQLKPEPKEPIIIRKMR